MKKLLLSALLLSFASHGYSEPGSGEDVLAFVRSSLPGEPITLNGSAETTTPGLPGKKQPVEIDLNWGAETPSAIYRIGDRGAKDYESLTVLWKNGKPIYLFSNPENRPSSCIPGMDITWEELSFSVLWWPDAKLAGEGKKNNRKYYMVDVPVPSSGNSMHLSIDKKKGLLLEARTLGPQAQKLTHLKVLSTKKRNDTWLAMNLEFKNRETGNRTTLIFSEVKWPSSRPPAAFDPVNSNNMLAIKLYKKLGSETDSNLLLSPYSISSALAMTYGGARGKTAEEIKRVLRFGGQHATHPAFAYLRTILNDHERAGLIQLRTANALWPQKGYDFHPEYLDLTERFYGSEIHPVDYEGDPEGSRQAINSWVEEQTNDRIMNLIAEGALTPDSRLVLVNTIYFKGDWDNPFLPSLTRPAPFHLMDGTTIHVPTMNKKDSFGYAVKDGCRALELPYKGNGLSMLVLLPTGKNTLALLENNLSDTQLNGLEFRKHEVILQLPTFKTETSVALHTILSDMGMPLAFQRRHADFSGLCDEGPLWIDSIVHKTCIHVAEEGTEASAATGNVTFFGASIGSKPIEFTVDRPFLFLIRENTTGTILFIGRVMDPSTES